MHTVRSALAVALLCMNGLSVMAAEALDGSRWILAELPPDELLARVTVTLAFDAGRVAGSDGCNRFQGTYTANDDGLRIGQLSSTMKACPEPVMQQAKAYAKALNHTYQVRIDGETLYLEGAEGNLLARFDAELKDLADTRWNVSGYNNGQQAVVSAGPDAAMTLAFDASGAVSGNAGCNNFRGDYTADTDALTVKGVAATRRLCEEAVMLRESAFLEALERSATWRAEGKRLEIRDAGGAMLVIANLAGPESSRD